MTNTTSPLPASQQFNTHTSLGRIMHNVLLSFAQFERDIISERTREKMAAARKKGKKDAETEPELRAVVAEVSWKRQRELWETIKKSQ